MAKVAQYTKEKENKHPDEMLHSKWGTSLLRKNNTITMPTQLNKTDWQASRQQINADFARATEYAITACDGKLQNFKQARLKIPFSFYFLLHTSATVTFIEQKKKTMLTILHSFAPRLANWRTILTELDVLQNKQGHSTKSQDKWVWICVTLHITFKIISVVVLQQHDIKRGFLKSTNRNVGTVSTTLCFL